MIEHNMKLIEEKMTCDECKKKFDTLIDLPDGRAICYGCLYGEKKDKQAPIKEENNGKS